MSVIKVIEIMADSDKSWEDAAKQAVSHASQTVKNIRSVYIKEQTATVSGDSITQYRVNCKISFEVK